MLEIELDIAEARVDGLLRLVARVALARVRRTDRRRPGFELGRVVRCRGASGPVRSYRV